VVANVVLDFTVVVDVVEGGGIGSEGGCGGGILPTYVEYWTGEFFRLNPKPSARKSTTRYSPLGFRYPNAVDERDSSVFMDSTGEPAGDVEDT
jgi:hypothetical protein